MKTSPIVPARWHIDVPGEPPLSLDFDDLYRPRAGAFTQAHDVFLAGNGLPQRWQGRERFVVLETGFGLGNNFLATWHAWRQDPQACRQLHFISIERHPLTRADLQQVHTASPLPMLAQALIDAWPPLTPNLHRLGFDGGRVQLLLALGDVTAWVPEISADVDAFYLNGFAPDRNPEMWQDPLFKGLARLAAPGATAATLTAAHAVRAGLSTAGFDVRPAPGPRGNGDVTLARFAPSFRLRRRPDARRDAQRNRQGDVPPSGPPDVRGDVRHETRQDIHHDARHPLGIDARRPEHRVLIVGAGLAGCAAAWALAEQGRHVTLIDRQAQPAQETSGNPAGLFHGIVNPQDGAHARFNRAAALEATRVVQLAIAEHGVPGSTAGLLRLDPSGAGLDELQRQLTATGLPGSYVQAVSAAQASALCGMPLQHPAWFYPGGGWVSPTALAGALLARAGTAASFRGGLAVQAIRACEDGWELLDACGQRIDAAPTLVLANAFDAWRLLGAPAWPVQKVRGQISLCPVAQTGSSARAAKWPTRPITGAGYLLPVLDGVVAFGATSQPGDEDASVRRADHVHNLGQLARLTDRALAIAPEALQGRTGWRVVSSDRLPIVGAVPDESAKGESAQGKSAKGDSAQSESAPGLPGTRRPDHPRSVPRIPGLFVFTALGARGITWSALGAQVLASSVTGAPQPLEADLLDAIDPARFMARAVRRRDAGDGRRRRESSGVPAQF